MDIGVCREVVTVAISTYVLMHYVLHCDTVGLADAFCLSFSRSSARY